MRGARAGLATLMFVVTSALCACHREPTFDERYASAQADMHSEAAGIDAELAARDSEAAAGDAVLATATPAHLR